MIDFTCVFYLTGQLTEQLKMGKFTFAIGALLTTKNSKMDSPRNQASVQNFGFAPLNKRYLTTSSRLCNRPGRARTRKQIVLLQAHKKVTGYQNNNRSTPWNECLITGDTSEYQRNPFWAWLSSTVF